MTGRGSSRAGAALAGVALVLVALEAAHAGTVRGVVFDDADGSGVREAGEAGVPGVRVSNGRDVVRTDAEGRYRLTIDDRAAVVFLTKPAGWATPVDADMLPQFHYLHRPGGSPAELRYAGIEPTGALPESVDFPLRRREEPERFEALLFADTQPQTHAEVDYLRDDVVAELVGTRARFGMTLGDILFDDLSLFPRYLSVIAQLGIPWYNVPGNHELNLDAAGDGGSLETFQRYFGPPYYAFEYGRALFVVLDNVFYRGGGRTDPADFRANGGYEGRLTERQLAWLENELALADDDRLVFLAMHIPLRTYTGEPERPSANTVNRRELFRVLRGRPNVYAVAGHTHTTEHHYFDADDGWRGDAPLHHHVLATVSGSWWSGPLDSRGIPVAEQRDGTPNGYHVLEVDGTELSVRYKAASLPADHQMRVYFDVSHHAAGQPGLRDYRHGEPFDGRFTADDLAAAHVVVNLFDGGPRSRVTLRVGDREVVAMTRARRPDLTTRALYLRHEATKKPWVQAVPSSHLWEADLPDDLAPGTYTVTVEAVDEFGRTHHAHRIVEVTGSSAHSGGAGAGGVRYPPE